MVRFINVKSFFFFPRSIEMETLEEADIHTHTHKKKSNPFLSRLIYCDHQLAFHPCAACNNNISDYKWGQIYPVFLTLTAYILTIYLCLNS